MSTKRGQGQFPKTALWTRFALGYSAGVYEHFDVLILGGGTAGCVFAGRLTEDPSRTVGLVEAGPDYGPYDGGRWPDDLLQARYMPDSHGWGFEDGRSSRARVLGGCSAHNACMVVWGSRGDYDEWSAFSAGGWSFASIEPYLRMAESELRTRLRAPDELGPWDSAVLEAAAELVGDAIARAARAS